MTMIKPTSLIVVDSTKVGATELTALKTKLYGGTAVAELPLPGDVLDDAAPTGP
jgi:hypothetical protein